MTWVAVGTAAAVGAGVGGLSAAAQGKGGDDVLKSALLGGTIGAVTGGAGAALGGASGTVGTLTEEGVKQVAEEGVKEGATQTLAQSAPEMVQNAATQPQGILQASGPSTSDVAGFQNDQSIVNMVKNAPPQQMVPTNELSPEVLKASGNAPTNAPQTTGSYGLRTGPNPVNTPFDTSVKGYTPGEFANAGDPRYPSTLGQLQPGVSNPNYQIAPPSTAANGLKLAATPPAETGFMQGFNQFVNDHPFYTGAGIYAVAKGTGILDQQSNPEPSSSYNYTGPRLSPNFKGGPYSEPNVYKPRYAAAGGIMQAGGPVEQRSQAMTGGQGNMFPQSQQEHTNFATPTQMPASAEIIRSDYDAKTDPYSGTVTMASGGIAHYYRGELATSTGGRKDVYGATQRFLDMYDPSSRYEAPAGGSNPDVGIFRDSSPSTRDKSALEASQIRQNALEKRNYINTGANYVPASRNMGQLSFTAPGEKAGQDKDYESVLAAHGGIMQANLGSYAAGGNPRLLRGPGDGMSDDIPASIGGKQPARLADGEFVVPADVVSHLGNGSTEAGAKKLHGMMDKVRMDRTGRKKQAPAVKPNKYIPK